MKLRRKAKDKRVRLLSRNHAVRLCRIFYALLQKLSGPSPGRKRAFLSSSAAYATDTIPERSVALSAQGMPNA